MPGKVKAKKAKRHRFYDLELLVSIIFLCVFGLVMIYSASSYKAQLDYGKSSYFVERQAFFELISFFFMLVVSKLDYHRFAKYGVPAYLLSFVLLILTAATPLGVASHGKKRWLRLGPVQFQPTEFIKIALILLIAVIIARIGVKVNELRNVRMIILMSLPLAMLVTMNNLSSGIIICGIVYVMLFVAVKKKWPFFALMGFLVGVLILAPYLGDLLVKMRILQDYQLARINVWRNPVKYSRSGGYQVLQGLYAIGSGGIFGKGLGQSLQKLGFVPEAQNDMIFSIVCEELGLFGAVCLILMFMFMIYRFLVIAENAPDLFGSMLVVGIMAHISIQVILNIAVVTNVIPNTGVTLPFISYGGTSVMLLMVEMGIALSVSNQIRQEENNV
ncbi:MAG: cell division protein FtsW [Clostridium sp.]|nr:cell division protein FtsW [Clostridium sp.]